jgi:hypothetical protein
MKLKCVFFALIVSFLSIFASCGPATPSFTVNVKNFAPEFNDEYFFFFVGNGTTDFATGQAIIKSGSVSAVAMNLPDMNSIWLPEQGVTYRIYFVVDHNNDYVVPSSGDYVYKGNRMSLMINDTREIFMDANDFIPL